MNKNRDTELYTNLVCALTHSLITCEECKKCEGKNAAEIRMNLIEKLSDYMEKDLPWTTTRMTEEYKEWIKK